MTENETNLIEKANAHGDIGPMDDGFQYFWVKNRGAFSSADLRVIADELDRLNEAWALQIARDIDALAE